MREPIWHSVAAAFLGLREQPGPGSNPLILRWARDIGAPAWYDDDDKPWCAIFLNRVLMACQLPLAGYGYDLLRARAFARYGQPLAAPALGAICVFERPGGGHVGLYVGEDGSGARYRIRGGNQGNAVADVWIDRLRLVAVRWPPDVALPDATGPVTLDDDGLPSSRDER